MRDVLILLIHLIVTVVRLARPGGLRSKNFTLVGYDRCGPAGANAVSCDYSPNLFKDRIRQNIGDEDRLPMVYCCVARSALWANNKSVQRRDVGFWKS